MKVAVVPLGEVSRAALAVLSEALGSYGLTCEVSPPEEMPRSAFDSKRGQHDADAILASLRKSVGGATLAVTAQDLYSGAYQFVFGLATLGGSLAVVSMRRLGPPEDERFRLRVAKEAMHELGHAWGLAHCADVACVMHFSHSVAEVDAKGLGPCQRCRERLPFALGVPSV